VCDDVEGLALWLFWGLAGARVTGDKDSPRNGAKSSRLRKRFRRLEAIWNSVFVDDSAAVLRARVFCGLDGMWIDWMSNGGSGESLR
jgi:hypothetical protein